MRYLLTTCIQDVKKHCWDALADIGATNEVCQVLHRAKIPVLPTLSQIKH